LAKNPNTNTNIRYKMKFEPPSYFSSDDDDSIMSLEDKFHLEPKAKSGGILPDDDYQPNDDDSVYVSKPKPKASPLKRKLEPVITKPQPASSATYAASGLKKLKLGMTFGFRVSAIQLTEPIL
jgi:hypothetical protein